MIEDTATARQVAYAMHLMAAAGYPTDYMSRIHRELGATMRERSGRVDAWLAAMSRTNISRLIYRLK